MLAPIRGGGMDRTVAVPSSIQRKKKGGQGESIAAAVADRVNANKAGAAPTEGRARKYFIAKEKATVDHDEFEAERKTYTNSLVKKVLNNVLSHPERAEPISQASIAASFADSALKQIYRELGDFPDRGEFFAHVASKLEWLLRELGDSADRCALITYKYEKIREEFTQVAAEKESTTQRLEAMKEVVSERTEAFHAAKLEMENKILDYRKEHASLKVKNAHLVSMTKRSKMGSTQDSLKVMKAFKGNGLFVGDDKAGKTEVEKNLEQLDLLNNALEHRQRETMGDGIAAAELSKHSQIIQRSGAEVDFERASEGRLIEEMRVMKKNFKDLEASFNEEMSRLREEKENLQQQVEEQINEAQKESDGYINEIGLKMAEHEQTKNKLKAAEESVQEFKEVAARKEEAVERLKQAAATERAAREEEILKMQREFEESRENDAANRQLDILRKEVAELLISNDQLKMQVARAEEAVVRTTNELSSLQKATLESKSSFDLLKRIRTATRAALEANGHEAIAALSKDPGFTRLHSQPKDFIAMTTLLDVLEEEIWRDMGEAESKQAAGKPKKGKPGQLAAPHRMRIAQAKVASQAGTLGVGNRATSTQALSTQLLTDLNGVREEVVMMATAPLQHIEKGLREAGGEGGRSPPETPPEKAIRGVPRGRTPLGGARRPRFGAAGTEGERSHSASGNSNFSEQDKPKMHHRGCQTQAIGTLQKGNETFQAPTRPQSGQRVGSASSSRSTEQPAHSLLPELTEEMRELEGCLNPEMMLRYQLIRKDEELKELREYLTRYVTGVSTFPLNRSPDPQRLYFSKCEEIEEMEQINRILQGRLHQVMDRLSRQHGEHFSQKRRLEIRMEASRRRARQLRGRLLLLGQDVSDDEDGRGLRGRLNRINANTGPNARPSSPGGVQADGQAPPDGSVVAWVPPRPQTAPARFDGPGLLAARLAAEAAGRSAEAEDSGKNPQGA